MAFFQASSSVTHTSSEKDDACKRKNGKVETNTSVSPSPYAETETEDSKACSSSIISNAHLNKTAMSSSCPPRSATCHIQEHISFLLRSYCDSLFRSLYSFKEKGLLLDCTLQLLGSSYKAHSLVLAAVSQKAEEWLCSQNLEVNLNNVRGTGCHITYAGLKAVLNFAYCVEVDTNYTEGTDLEEVLIACRCLGVDRLTGVYKAEVPFTGRVERERSLQAIRTLWKRRVGCDVILEVESGERFPGNHSFG